MEFKDPPEEARRTDRNYWRTVVHELGKHEPDKWAFVGRWSVGVASRIRRGEYVAFVPKGMVDKAQRKAYMDSHYEVYSCNSDDFAADIYVKRLP